MESERFDIRKAASLAKRINAKAHVYLEQERVLEFLSPVIRKQSYV